MVTKDKVFYKDLFGPAIEQITIEKQRNLCECQWLSEMGNEWMEPSVLPFENPYPELRPPFD